MGAARGAASMPAGCPRGGREGSAVADEAIPVAIIGCGWAGTRHARAFVAAGAAVRWLIDVQPARATALARALGTGQVARDYREALADPTLVAVSLCLPHHLHAPVALAAAQAGKQIVCEKPLATSLAEADQMIAAAERAGVLLMVAENVHYDPLFQRVRALLHDGAIGRVALLTLTRHADLARSFREERPWFLDAHQAAGGMMMTGGIHDVETLRLLHGEIAWVWAQPAPRRVPEMTGDDTSLAVVRFGDGALGLLLESMASKRLGTAGGAEVHTLQVEGAWGSLAVDGDRRIRVYSERSERGAPTEQVLAVPPADTFAAESAHFLAAIRSGTSPRTSGRSQRRALEIVLAAYHSMASGHPVTLPPP